MKYKIYNDDNDGKYASIISFDDSIIDVIIPKSISFESQIIPVKKIDEDAFKNNSKIRSITIPNSVTTIGSSAFSGCSNLITVTISENSQLTSIGSYAFNGCSSLTSIYIPDSVTTIGSFAFKGCSNLTIYCEASSEPSGWNSLWNYAERPVIWSFCLGMHGYFNDFEYGVCIDDDGNKYITILGYNGSNANVVIPEYIKVNGKDIVVKAIAGNTFHDNDKIASVTIPNSVTIIGSSAFSRCSNLATVTISESSQLTSIGSSAFNGCSSLTSIYIPDSVTTIGPGAFSRCSNLATVTISESSQLTSIGNEAFWNCSSLTSIYIPNSVTTIGVSAFDGCSSLTSIYIPDSVTSIGSRAFRYSSNLTIYCEASSEPSGWDSSWNFYCPVVWSSNGEHGEYNGFTYGVSIDSEGNPYITITGYDGFNFDLVIPEYIEVNGEQIVVKEISNTAFGYYGITSINIPDGVTSIGYCAFYNCSNLKTVSISKNSQLTTIGRKAFNGCSSLTSICIPSSVAAIKYGAFENCSSLIICCEVPSTPNGWDSSWNYPCPVVWSSNGQYREYSGFIYGVCTDSEEDPYITIAGYTGSSTNVVIPSSINVDGEDIPVKAIASNAFRNNDTITSVTIPNSVTIIGNSAFRDSPYLTIYCEASSEPSGWDSSWNWGCPVVRSSYLGMHGYFDDFEYGVCIDEDGNKYVTITGYDGSDADVVIPESINVNGENIIVKAIADNAFRNNDAIASVTISDSVTTIGLRAFDGCSSLTSIYIPDSVTTIGSYAFEDCSNLTIYCQACSKPSGWAYDWCDEFSDDRPVVWSSYLGMHGYFDDFEYGVCIDEDGNKYVTITGYNASNTDVVIPESINVNGENIIVKAIADNAFNRSSLTSIYIPDSVTAIGYSAFYSCSNLTTVTISESSQLTTIGSSAFSGCSSLTSIYIPDSVTAIGSNAFSGCSSLTSIYIPDSVTTIGSDTFSRCSNLATVTISESSQLTTIGSSAFSGCSSLTSIYIPDSVTAIGSSTFLSCSSLTSIYIPDSVTTIGSYAFSDCSNLATVTFGESSQLTSIGSFAFDSCSSLTSIYIPDSVTTIGSYAFSDCSNLATVTFGENSQLTSIGLCAFNGCSSLTSIYIPDSVTTIGEEVFSYCSSLIIYCEASSQPNGWNSNWNPSNRPVVWETTYEEYLGGDCGQKTLPF